jgi:hypothetical protein
MNALRVRLSLRKILPLVEIESLEGAVVGSEHRLCATFKQKCQGPPYAAHVDRLPKAIEHQNLLIQA